MEQSEHPAPNGGLSVSSPRPGAIEFEMSGDLGPLFAALAKAQAGYGEVKRTDKVKVFTTQGSYEFQYAPLENILAACLPALNKAELYFSQPLYKAHGEYVLETILGHSSGAYMRGRISIPQPEVRRNDKGEAKENPIQKLGSAITYLRRYSAQSILGVSAEDDDDGNAADGNHIAERQRRAEPPRPTQARKPAQDAPKAQPAPKPAPKPEPAPEVKPEPARAKSEPPPDPRQTTVEEYVAQKAEVTQEQAAERTYEPEPRDAGVPHDDAPINPETKQAIARLIGIELGIPKREAMDLFKVVTGHDAVKGMALEAPAQVFLKHLQGIVLKRELAR